MVKFIETFLQCYKDVTIEHVVVALIYIDRVLATYEDAALTEVNGKGLLHVALTLSAKFFIDNYKRQTKFFGIVCGLQPLQMRKYTDSLLSMLDF